MDVFFVFSMKPYCIEIETRIRISIDFGGTYAVDVVVGATAAQFSVFT